MALLDRRVEIQWEPLSGRIPKTTAERVKEYARFVNRDRAEVIAGLLDYAMGKDKEFAHWLKDQSKPNGNSK